MAIAENLARVRDEVWAACRQAGRGEGEVALMAVSKVHPVECLEEAYAAGQRLFGENRVQEMQAKAEVTRGLAGAAFHLIGPLQSNKTGKAAELFDEVETVAEERIGRRLAEAARAAGRVLPVLVEVKLSHEEAKHGVRPEELEALVESLSGMDGIAVRGLMTVPPWSEEGEAARPYFRELRRLRDGLASRYAGVTELSMGMSGDFAVAIEEGSTVVRVGTAIFGRRVKAEGAAH